MTCFVLGCGDTGAYMPPNEAHVIGVNDAFKFNKNLDQLLLMNRPRHFNEPALYVEGSRLDVIKHTYTSEVITLPGLEPEWGAVFPDAEIRIIRTERFRRSISGGIFYHIDSSPFTAMSYAQVKGYNEIVLWGVDFVNHRWLTPESCVPQFSRFAFYAEKLGCRIYKGHRDSKLTFPIWAQS